MADPHGERLKLLQVQLRHSLRILSCFTDPDLRQVVQEHIANIRREITEIINFQVDIKPANGSMFPPPPPPPPPAART